MKSHTHRYSHTQSTAGHVCVLHFERSSTYIRFKGQFKVSFTCNTVQHRNINYSTTSHTHTEITTSEVEILTQRYKMLSIVRERLEDSWKNVEFHVLNSVFEYKKVLKTFFL